MEDAPIAKDARIAVVGAGPAGLSVAWFLQEAGYENVTVLEKLGRVGGLCKSITVRGRSYDLGANYVTWAYRETLKIARRVGAKTTGERPYTSIEMVRDDDGKAVGTRFRRLRDATLFDPYTNERVSVPAFVWAALRYLRIRLGLRSVIDRPDYLARIDGERHPELCVDFRAWLEDNDLEALASLFEFPITIMGYGQLDHIAAPYALRYMSVRTVVPMFLQWPPAKWLFRWPKRFVLGFQRLWQEVAWRLDVRLNVSITEITRDPGDATAPIRMRFTTQHQELNDVDRDEWQMEFDYLILACPLTPDVFDQLGLERTPAERAMSDGIHFHPYCMTTYWVRGLDMPAPIAPVLPLAELGEPWAIAQQYEDEGVYFTQFYTRVNERLPSDAPTERHVDEIEAYVRDEVRELVSLMNGTIEPTLLEWSTYDRFTYFQHVEVDQIADGYYARLAELQGQNRTYYVGGVTDFELVEPIVEHSKHLVERHFTRTSRGSR